MPVQVVWFKRDLRVLDHQPLWQASQRGQCISLYVYEPELLAAPEFDASHLVFINQALADLDRSLRGRGGRLIVRSGRMPEVLDEFHRSMGIEALWSHQETGGAVTYARDRRVARWARSQDIPWHEFSQDGVVRRLRSRDGWAGLWTSAMNRPETPIPRSIITPNGLEPGPILDPTSLGLAASTKTEAQRGGETSANAVLDSFLHVRGAGYQRALSSPVTARRGCSRLSPHLAWGCISTARVHRAVRAREVEIGEARDAGIAIDPRWSGALRSFRDRLRWRGHFMQKLEDEPAIEFRNFSRAYDGLREDEFQADRFDAWCVGQTGYPMIDACMRALHRGGWINFRMRAMLMSFASYHLWLHWRATSLVLARHFLDFEPGIHFPQSQMQSGTTGINTLRIYSPAKQAEEHDPRGEFIRRYVPELEPVPDEYLAEPHLMPTMLQQMIGCVIGRDYPVPIVDHATAYRNARDRMDRAGEGLVARSEAKRVLQKHGSRGKRRR